MPPGTPPVLRTRSRGGRLAVGLVVLAAAAAYVGVRFGATMPFPTFAGACERLRASGLPITGADWFCAPEPWTAHASYLAAAFFVWLAYVVPCSILAATGRRFTALLPMVVAPFLPFTAFFAVQVRWWGTPFWPSHSQAALFVDVLCLSAPVAAIAFANRHRRPRPASEPWIGAAVGAAAILLVPTLVLGWLASAILVRHLEQIGSPTSWKDLITPFASIAVFGALLGPNRRWWPWSLAPVALFLSLGPVGAVLTYPQGFQVWSQFGVVAPLAMTGLVWSAWWPLAARITPHREPAVDPERTLAVPIDAPASTDAPRPIPARRPVIRRVVVANALAASLLAISMVAFRADPMPAQIGTSLSTFLGVRTNWQDVRARLDLRRAMTAMDDYAAAHGSYRGFNAADGRAADGSLLWTSASSGSAAPTLSMLVSNRGASARIGTLSESGSAFCIGRSSPGAPLTYGSASAILGNSAPAALLHRAFGACGNAPWTAQLYATVPVASLCAGRAGHDSDYLICRMVQALGVRILSNTKPV